MRFFGRQTARQKEIRRSRAERRQAWYQRLGGQVHMGPAVFLVFCAVTTALLVNAGTDGLGLTVGQKLPRDITSRVTFRIVDEAATDRMRSRARDNAEDHYELDASLLQDIRGRLTNALRIAREQAAEPQKLKEKAEEIKVLFDDAGLAEILRLAALPDASEYQHAVDRAVRVLRGQPLAEASDLARRRTGLNAILVDVEQALERPVPNSELLFANNPEHVLKVVDTVVAAADFAVPLRDTMRASLREMLRDPATNTHKPLYRYDTRRSNKAAQDAENRVETQYNVFTAGTRLAPLGTLTESTYELLKEEQARYLDPDWGMQDAQTAELLRGVPQMLVRERWARGFAAFLLVIGVGGGVMLIYGNLPGGAQRRTASALTMLVVLGLARATYVQGLPVHLAVGLQAFAIALLAITSRGGPVYAAGGVLALMVTLATRQSVSLLIVLMAVTMVLFLGLRDVRHRGHIIGVGALAALVALAFTQLAGLIEGQYFRFVFWHQAMWAALSTLAAAFLVEGILPAIERVFGVTTSMTLLEWCDPNKPLLRMLAAESPGTYNHSLLVGTLADAAAEAIGADGLLARTGAYYHDIGKVNKPEYFVENQAMGVGNRHERLSPAMSHLIIIGHVKDGIEMAREYGLPASLHSFIPEHHGTCVVEYFYHAASRARKPGDPEISDEQFRYPGPKPQSRETAIVMLCDGVEGAVRAMTEPTPNRIEDTVAKIIEKRMMDGQFDDCDLTFRELETIRNSLVKSLSSIYHGRIAYPSTEQSPEPRSAS
ncbi:MAG: HDIG domain-containing protein [Phycisphaerae bacterium]|nr:HDIG domain-containing protein [Phycisphaerae bacterium]